MIFFLSFKLRIREINVSRDLQAGSLKLGIVSDGKSIDGGKAPRLGEVRDKLLKIVVVPLGADGEIDRCVGGSPSGFHWGFS